MWRDYAAAFCDSKLRVSRLASGAGSAGTSGAKILPSLHRHTRTILTPRARLATTATPGTDAALRPPLGFPRKACNPQSALELALRPLLRAPPSRGGNADCAAGTVDSTDSLDRTCAIDRIRSGCRRRRVVLGPPSRHHGLPCGRPSARRPGVWPRAWVAAAFVAPRQLARRNPGRAAGRVRQLLRTECEPISDQRAGRRPHPRAEQCRRGWTRSA